MLNLPPPAQSLVRREPVWVVWSELYLDTEHCADLLEGDARTLASSAYTLDELRYILWQEVHPACFGNLFTATGEWEMFSIDWLRKLILRRAEARVRLPAGWFPSRFAIRRKAQVQLSRVAALRRG